MAEKSSITHPQQPPLTPFAAPVAPMGSSLSSPPIRPRWQTLVYRVSVLLCGVSLLATLSLVGWHVYDRRHIVQTARRVAQDMATAAARQIEEKLSKLRVAQTLAEELTSAWLPDHRVEDRLKRALERHPEVSAFTACYTPAFVPSFVRQAEQQLYCPYAYKNRMGDVVIRRVEDDYDYTIPDRARPGPEGKPIRTVWYHRPLAEGSTWGEPYWGAGAKVYWAGFGTPFYRTDPSTQQQVPAGIVSADMTLKEFQDLVRAVDLGKPGAGYGFILSHTGVFISHPIDAFVHEEKTLADFDASLHVNKLRSLATTAPDGEVIVIDRVDPQSGRSAWVFFAPVTSPGWWVGIVLDKEEIFRSSQIARRLQRQWVGIAMGTGAFLFCLSVLLLRAHQGTSRSLWAASMSFSLLCMEGVGYLWVLNTTPLAADNVRNVLLVDKASTAKIVADYAKEISGPVLVPTGVFVQSMEFSDAHNVSLTGYIWQTYTDAMPAWVKPELGAEAPGFTLPQADVVYKEEIIEAYRRRQGKRVVIGWYFRAVLRQEFDVSRYPFDRGDVWIRIRPKDFDRGVLLTPDLASYTMTNPATLPGMEQQEFVLEGWNIERSFFSYRANRYNTDFGIQTLAGQHNSPELYFNITLRRRFVDAFISHIIPLAVVAFLLFAALVIVTSHEEKMGLRGFNTSTVLAYCAALFFVTIVGHISLRSGLEAPGIVYLEFFYFVTYGAILSVSVNAILFTSHIHIWCVQYRDSLVMELLFWPTLFGFLLVITLGVFL